MQFCGGGLCVCVYNLHCYTVYSTNKAFFFISTNHAIPFPVSSSDICCDTASLYFHLYSMLKPSVRRTVNYYAPSNPCWETWYKSSSKSLREHGIQYNIYANSQHTHVISCMTALSADVPLTDVWRHMWQISFKVTNHMLWQHTVTTPASMTQRQTYDSQMTHTRNILTCPDTHLWVIVK